MFEPKKRSLKELLDTPSEGDSQSQFVVPRFQRKYEWEKEGQVATLINDVFSNLDRQYFVGPMIFYPKGEGKVEIIDGQQRLVTFAIFFRALVDYIQKRREDGAFSTVQSDEVENLNYDIRNLIIKGRRERVPVLRLSPKIDRDFRQEIILSENPQKVENFKSRQRGEHPAVKRLKSAYLKIFESLIERYGLLKEVELLNKLQDLVDALEDKQTFVSLTVNSYNDAYTIFETINARGKALNLSDLVKIVCFEKLHTEEPDETYLDDLESYWDKAEEKVSDFGAFIWHLWVSNYKSCSKKKVFTKIEEHFKTITKAEAERFIYDTIFDEADWYYTYENPDEIPESDDITLEKKRNLEMLKAMGVTRCYPLLLSIDYCAKPTVNTITKRQANELLKKIVCLTFWHSGICVEDARHLEAIYHGLALRMRNMRTGPSEVDVNYVLNELSKQFPSEDVCKDNFLSKSFDNGNFVKMMLRNMEDQTYPPAEKGLKGSKQVWWEHVLPEHARKDSEWEKTFEDERERMEYVGRLGNHALLYGPTNRRIGNQDFSEKKERYGDSDCGLTREIAKYDKWDKGTIEERTKELLELAKLAWPIG
ncbi:MAG: DUF262 domain-containing protein [Candidatus Aminicenantes bacterium]|nr:MAG: DUF262 domain-containing protein [Candidatus Aminicenantes bacterium]